MKGREDSGHRQRQRAAKWITCEMPDRCIRRTESNVKNLLARWFGKSAGAGRRPRTRACGLRLEALEDRMMPATISVTTFADVVNPADGKVSLREAISRANATAEPDTIVLKAGLYKITIPYSPANLDPNATGAF